MANHWNTANEDRPTSFLEHLLSGGSDSTLAMADHIIHDNGQRVEDSIRQGTTIAAMEGLFKLQHGMAGFVLKGWSSRDKILGVNIALGLPKEQISLQSELAGY